MVQPTFIAITKPLVPRTLDLVSRARPKRLIVVPYLLFGGILVERMNKLIENFSKKYAWIDCQMAPYIGFHEAVYEVLDRRLNQALEGKEDLPCDNCSYRTENARPCRKGRGLESNALGVCVINSRTLKPCQLTMPIRRCKNTYSFVAMWIAPIKGHYHLLKIYAETSKLEIAKKNTWSPKHLVWAAVGRAPM